MSVDKDKAATEGAVIICCDTVQPEHVILKILGAEILPEVTLTKESIKGYPWQVDTKYYTALVNLYAIEDKKLLSSEFCESVRAIIFYFDSNKLTSFENVLSWMTYVQYYQSDVQLLVCDNCSSDRGNPEVSRKTVLDWCLKNHFELVELNSEEESDDDEDEIFKDVKGYSRIVQALKSNTWANLKMKNECHAPCQQLLDKFSGEENEMIGSVGTNIKEMKLETEHETGFPSHRVTQNGSGLAEGLDSIPKLSNDSSMSEILNKDDPVCFEELFAQFASMKEKASTLIGDERKKYAEEVAIAFWRAIGGDEDEIAGLDPDE